MKILWLVNIVMPDLAEHLGRKVPFIGGWLSGAMKAVEKSENELVICTTEQNAPRETRYFVNGITYYLTERTNEQNMRSTFRQILQQEKPDVVHIYGTEYEQSWAMAQEADIEKTVVTIQGSMIYYEKVTYGGLPEHLCRDNLFHKVLRKLNKGGNSIDLQRKSFAERAHLEQKTLQHVKYINGGSGWGNAVARAVNPSCVTLDCNLILRDSFYCEERWNQATCEPHTIFVLFSYPIKGFHMFLEALPTILAFYPDTKVYVGSSKLFKHRESLVNNVIWNLAPDYNWIIQKQIQRLHLESHIEFLGGLSEAEIKKRLLKTNVFVSPSIIENQSTMLGEAMILGVPSVASCVGAMLEMIDHGKDGLLYPYHEPYLLADAVCSIFSDPMKAKQLSKQGHAHAAMTYDREKNGRNLIEMYQTIANAAKGRET